MNVIVNARVSIYPLRQEHLNPAVEVLRKELEAHGLHLQIGVMRPQAVGETEAMFAGIRDSFMRVAANGRAVMAVTISNACPV